MKLNCLIEERIVRRCHERGHDDSERQKSLSARDLYFEDDTTLADRIRFYYIRIEIFGVGF